MRHIIVVIDAYRAPEQANGSTHRGCPLKHLVVLRWLRVSSQRATGVAEKEAQNSCVTVDTPVAACELAFADLIAHGAATDRSVLQYRQLTIKIIVILSWGTMLRPVTGEPPRT